MSISIFLASTGFFLLYLGFAWCVAQGLQTVRRRHPALERKER